MGDEPSGSSAITRRDLSVAAVSFLISGVGGALFQSWLSRAKPSIAIVSLGFGGSASLVPITTELKRKSAADVWGDNFEDLEPFEALQNRYAETESLKAKHEVLIPLIEQWIRLTSSRLAAKQLGPTEQLTDLEVVDHPNMTHALFVSALEGMIARREITNSPPVKDFEQFEVRLPTQRRDKGDFDRIALQHGMNNYWFPLNRMDTPQKKQLMTLVVESFSRGISRNLLFFSEVFLSAAKDNLLKLKALSDSLKEALLKNAHLTVVVSLRNMGATPIVFRQYYALEIHARQYSRTYVMVAQPTNAGDRKKSPRDPIGSSPKFLPTASESRFVSVAASSVEQTTLHATQPLDKDGEQILTLFQNDILECRLSGVTIEGTEVSSDRVPFGQKSIEEQQRQVIANIRK